MERPPPDPESSLNGNRKGMEKEEQRLGCQALVFSWPDGWKM
jgi:hypothetical protein